MTDEKSLLSEHASTITTIAITVVGSTVAGLRYLLIGPILNRLDVLEDQNKTQHDAILTMNSSLGEIRRKMELDRSASRQDEIIEKMAKAQMEVLKKSGWEPPKAPRRSSDPDGS